MLVSSFFRSLTEYENEEVYIGNVFYYNTLHNDK